MFLFSFPCYFCTLILFPTPQPLPSCGLSLFRIEKTESKDKGQYHLERLALRLAGSLGVAAVHVLRLCFVANTDCFEAHCWKSICSFWTVFQVVCCFRTGVGKLQFMGKIQPATCFCMATKSLNGWGKKRSKNNVS